MTLENEIMTGGRGPPERKPLEQQVRDLKGVRGREVFPEKIVDMSEKGLRGFGRSSERD